MLFLLISFQDVRRSLDLLSTAAAPGAEETRAGREPPAVCNLHPTLFYCRNM